MAGRWQAGLRPKREFLCNELFGLATKLNGLIGIVKKSKDPMKKDTPPVK